MRVKAIMAVAVALSLALSLASCRGSGKRTIAVVPKATSHVFWTSVQAGAMAAGEKFGVKVLWNGPAQETEYDRQIEIVDSMIAQHVDGLAVAAAERKALVQSIDRAMSLGIPVAVFDSGVDSTNYLTFIATNNYDAGQLGARELAKLLNGKGKAAIIMHEPGSASTMDRERGFDDLMTKEFPGITVVARQYGHSDRSKARGAAENILAAHPDLDGMFASSEPSSIGAALAIRSRGLGGKIKFVAFDSSESLIEDLKAGVITAMVVQDPFKMGFEAVKVLVDKLNGINPAKRIDLIPTVVEKQDLEKPEIKELLYPDVKKYLK
jgi:ribose transport system substrate-binding protein